MIPDRAPAQVDSTANQQYANAEDLRTALRTIPAFNDTRDDVVRDAPTKAGKKEIEDALITYLETIFKESSQPTGKPKHVVAGINAAIAEIDALISAQVNEILHDPDFQALEASWKGLEGLITNSSPQAGRLEINVFNIEKKELVEHLDEYQGNTITESPLYRIFYREGLGVLGGAPIGCFAGDFYFNQETEDVIALEGMSKLAAACHAPFISSVEPKLFGVNSWPELTKQTDVSVWNHFESSSTHEKWRSLRSEPDSQYLGLTLFRILGREPYQKAKGFTFKEETQGRHENYLWVNSVFGFAENLANAYFKYDWPVQWRGIEGGGLLPRLPKHVLDPSQGADATVGPVEVTTPMERESVLSKLGFLPALQIKNTSDAVFLGAQSFQEPGSYFGPDGVQATENAELHARLPYTFAACRILHCLTRLAQQKIGTLSDEVALQKVLTDWLNQYVEPNPDKVGEQQRRRRPLRAAEVKVVPVKGKPGYYEIKLKVRPHYQFEGADIDLSLSSQVGGKK